MLSSRAQVGLLGVCFAFSATSASLNVAAASLVGHAIAENKALATLPLSLNLLGTMSAGLPASLLMRRFGRRAIFFLGVFLGALGASTAAYAIMLESFFLFCLSIYCIGLLLGIGQLYRFAAVDVAEADFRARAISLVMAGGLVAGILGPGIASFARDLLPEARFAGSYLTIIGLYAIIALLLMFVRLPPMSSGPEGSVKRPLSLVFRQPKLIAALTSASLGYAVMALVMTATPLAMTHHHHEFPDAALVIQWHVVGMYAPSFFTGNLIQRFGAVRIMALGVLLNVICVGINLSGQTWWHFWVALILLGVGWNFMFVGGTSLLTETYLPEEKATVQGVNDLIVFALAATGSLMAGVLLNLFGWQWVNLLALPILALAFGVLGWYARTLSTQEAAEAAPS